MTHVLSGIGTHGAVGSSLASAFPQNGAFAFPALADLVPLEIASDSGGSRASFFDSALIGSDRRSGLLEQLFAPLTRIGLSAVFADLAGSTTLSTRTPAVPAGLVGVSLPLSQFAAYEWHQLAGASGSEHGADYGLRGLVRHVGELAIQGIESLAAAPIPGLGERPIALSLGEFLRTDHFSREPAKARTRTVPQPVRRPYERATDSSDRQTKRPSGTARKAPQRTSLRQYADGFIRALTRLRRRKESE